MRGGHFASASTLFQSRNVLTEPLRSNAMVILSRSDFLVESSRVFPIRDYLKTRSKMKTLLGSN